MRRKSGKCLKKTAAGLYATEKGDHDIWYSPETDRNFPVDHVIKSRYTANGIMKQAGIDHRF